MHWLHYGKPLYCTIKFVLQVRSSNIRRELWKRCPFVKVLCALNTFSMGYYVPFYRIVSKCNLQQFLCLACKSKSFCFLFLLFIWICNWQWCSLRCSSLWIFTVIFSQDWRRSWILMSWGKDLCLLFWNLKLFSHLQPWSVTIIWYGLYSLLHKYICMLHTNMICCQVVRNCSAS